MEQAFIPYLAKCLAEAWIPYREDNGGLTNGILYFEIRSKKGNCLYLIQELPPEVVKASKEAILQAASEGKTFVNIEKLYPDVAGKLATLYRMLDFQTEVIMSDVYSEVYANGGRPCCHVTIKWED